MATFSNRDIVTRALRMVGVLGRSEEPEADELRDGMAVLESMYLGWFTGGMFGKLEDRYEIGDYEAGEGQRIYVEDGTVTLPDLIDEDRRPRDLVAVEVDNGTTRTVNIWDRTKWVRLDSLEPAAPAPLSDRGANALAACLAVNFAEEFGAAIPASVMLQCRNFKAALSFKFGTTQEPLHGQWF